jgi:hypothetical protein
MPNVQPNEYTLKGENITFTFVKHNFLGQPFAQYSDGTQTRDYFGSAVRVLETGIGTLVTVTTFMTIDTGGTEFSVLLPVIELTGPNSAQSFSTDGIITHYKGPDSFPLTGVRERYEFIPMQGTAREIFPFLEKTKFAVSKAG